MQGSARRHCRGPKTPEKELGRAGAWRGAESGSGVRGDADYAARVALRWGSASVRFGPGRGAMSSILECQTICGFSRLTPAL